MKHEFIRNVHYYIDDTRVVFTALYHIQRGECCGNKCKHCPFEPQYDKGSTTIQKEFLEEPNN
jgi:biotin synthase-like enzyme